MSAWLVLFLAIWLGWACCGPVWAQNETTVKNAVRKWIKERIEKPASYKGIDWSKLVKHQPSGPYAYSIRHLYQVTTKDGQTLVFDVIFSFEKGGEIMGCETVKGGREPQGNRWRP